MKGEELMIGNWVTTPKGYERLLEFDRDTVFVDRGEEFSQIYSFDKIKPIPITEEILLKCEGVKKFNIDWCEIEIYGIEISINIKTNNITIQDNYTDEVLLNIKCEYLHQLQNLIYALTNEQLKIEL